MTVDAMRSGIDLTYVDADARPQDDLFGHVNGRWLADHEMPADRATDGAFRLLADRAEEQVRDLITEAAPAGRSAATRGSTARRGARGTDEQRIGDLYASFMDTDTIARIGVAPLLDELAVIDAAADPDALAAVLGALQRTGVGGGTGVYVDTDSKDSTRYLLHLSQSGLGLPDESYYRDPQHAEILAAYPEHIARMFALVLARNLNRTEWSTTAERIVALETKIAAAHWDVVKRRDADLTYNLRTFAELPTEAPGFDWAGWVTAVGTTPGDAAEVVVRQPDALTAFAATVVQRAARGLEVVAALAFDQRPRLAADRRPGRGELRLLRPHPLGHRGSCATAGSAASGSSRASWATRWASSTSSATSRPTPRRGWTSWWRTCARPTASASPSSTG